MLCNDLAASIHDPNTLRAANDVKYCMIVASATMWIFRIFCSVVLGKWMGLGVFGVWVAMTLDWVFRGILFVKRYIQGKWQMNGIDLNETAQTKKL